MPSVRRYSAARILGAGVSTTTGLPVRDIAPDRLAAIPRCQFHELVRARAGPDSRARRPRVGSARTGDWNGEVVQPKGPSWRSTIGCATVPGAMRSIFGGPVAFSKNARCGFETVVIDML